jgi:hypothetical protein
MAKRKALSKKIRFEVFKRDKFTCNYCGRSPVIDDVVLEVDHIVPVKEGGNNHMLNLLTSCFDCNRGKAANKIDDNKVVAQQKKQLDLEQDKKEQMELVFQWHKDCQGIDDEKNKRVFEYVNNLLITRSINATGEANLIKLTKKFQLKDVLKAIDISADTYFRYDEDHNLTMESASLFIDKIGGILFNMNRSAIENKSSYIKGICRNRFSSYFSEQISSIILKQYTVALDQAGWSEERILADLEDEVIPLSKEAKSWALWKQQMERWIFDIKGWNPQEPDEELIAEEL